MGRGWKIGKRRGEVISASPPPPTSVTAPSSCPPPHFCPALFLCLMLLEGGVTLELRGDLQQARLMLDFAKYPMA